MPLNIPTVQPPTYKLGKLPADYSKPRLWAEDYYVSTALPTPPLYVDRESRVAEWPMYLNDKFGDCTIAGIGHVIGAQATYAHGLETTFSDNQIETAYTGVCPGFNPVTDANDNGAVLSDVLAYMKSTGMGGHTISAYAQLRAMDIDSLKLALYLFGSVYIGVNLPRSAEDQFAAGEPWTYVKGSRIAGGHCVAIQKITPGFPNPYSIVTWGKVVRVQELWLETYMDEAWVAIGPDWIQSNKMSIDGLNLTQLTDDMNAI
jgi:hypothetical protein